jgi:hypothetical protein
MSHQEFIEKCNESGAAKKTPSVRYDQAARSCGEVEGFTRKGLSFLASLLSDEFTASGQLNEKGEMPDKSKRWSMGFLAEFNSEGHLCGDNPSALRDFALQLSQGEDHYQPATLAALEQKSKSAIIPSREILMKVIEAIRCIDGEVTCETIIDEIEVYYEDHDMTLPQDWEKITEGNMKRWGLV